MDMKTENEKPIFGRKLTKNWFTMIINRCQTGKHRSNLCRYDFINKILL